MSSPSRRLQKHTLLRLLLIPRFRCRLLGCALHELYEVCQETLASFSFPIRPIVIGTMTFLEGVRHIPIAGTSGHRIQSATLERRSGETGRLAAVRSVLWALASTLG